MQVKLKIKYDVFFSNKTYLRNSCHLVPALTFVLFSVAPSFVVKLCCRLNLCKDLSLGKKKTFSNNNKLFPRTTGCLRSWLKHLHVHAYWVSSVQRKATVLF